MKQIRKSPIFLSVLILLLTTNQVFAATGSTKICSVSPTGITGMAGSATDGKYIYVLKFKNEEPAKEWMILSYTSKGVLVHKQTFNKQIKHPNGLTYYGGYLYIATEDNFSTRVKVNTSTGEILSTIQSWTVPFSGSGITCVGAITHVTGNQFIIKGYGHTFALYSLISSESGFQFNLISKISCTKPSSAFNSTQDIFYHNGKIYVATFRKENDGVSYDKRANRLITYKYNSSNKTLTYDNYIGITGGSAGKVFEIESGCVLNKYIYYVTNDENHDSIYRYDTAQ